MHTSYSQLLLKKMQLFDLRMVMLVKVVTYFIASHHPQVMIDLDLESDIYQLTIRTLIGTFLLI